MNFQHALIQYEKNAIIKSGITLKNADAYEETFEDADKSVHSNNVF